MKSSYWIAQLRRPGSRRTGDGSVLRHAKWFQSVRKGVSRKAVTQGTRSLLWGKIMEYNNCLHPYAAVVLREVLPVSLSKCYLAVGSEGPSPTVAPQRSVNGPGFCWTSVGLQTPRDPAASSWAPPGHLRGLQCFFFFFLPPPALHQEAQRFSVVF